MRMWSLMGNWFFNLFSMFGFLFTPRYSSHLCRFSQNPRLVVTELGSVKTEHPAPAEKDNSENFKKPIIAFMHLTDYFFICISRPQRV